jgi:Ca2+-binding RTX toxin-like protein
MRHPTIARVRTGRIGTYPLTTATHHRWIETLESRQLLSVSLSAAGVLTVTGTATSNAIVVSHPNPTNVVVRENGQVTGTFPLTSVKSIVVNGLGGNDSLQVLDFFNVPATLNGGDGDDFLRGGDGKDVLNGGNGNDVLDGSLNADILNGNAGTDTADYSNRNPGVTVSLDGIANDGNPKVAENDNVMADVENIIGSRGADTLIGNAGPNVLVGNSGNDVLRGGAGLDVLIGGVGLDNLDGGGDGDLLIGSQTTYDANAAALRTIGYEWRNPANNYATKIARLKAGTPGVALNKTTVPTDLAVDSLTGNTGQDWFITHWGDVLKDRVAAETVTLLSSPIRWVSQVRKVSSDAAAGYRFRGFQRQRDFELPRHPGNGRLCRVRQPGVLVGRCEDQCRVERFGQRAGRDGRRRFGIHRHL